MIRFDPGKEGGDLAASQPGQEAGDNEMPGDIEPASNLYETSGMVLQPSELRGGLGRTREAANATPPAVPYLEPHLSIAQ